MKESSYKYAQVYQAMREKIAGGTYRPGEKLPSLRQLSQSLKIALITVQRAYAELEAEGLISAVPRSGYRVAVPVSFGEKPRNPLARPLKVDGFGSDFLSSVTAHNRNPKLLGLGGASMARELLPLRHLAECSRQVLRESFEQTILYEPWLGNLELKREIAKRNQRWRGESSLQECLITSGGTEALFLALRSVTRPGDLVAVESPTYFGLLRMLKALSLRVIELPTEAATGMRLDLLEPLLRRREVKACVLIPNFQNPLGSLMPEESKRKIVEMAEAKGIPLLEMETCADIFLSGERPLPLQAYARNGGVLSCISYSKLIAPGYRIGVLQPGRFLAEAAAWKASSTLASPSFPQLVLARFFRYGLADRHFQRLRSFFQLQIPRMIDLLLRELPPGARVSQPQGGYLLWVELPQAYSGRELFQQAVSKGISLTPGEIFSSSGRYGNFIRLNCGLAWDDRLISAVGTLGRLTRKSKKP
jgi:DNA-binding transcriptional MocR family regulator